MEVGSTVPLMTAPVETKTIRVSPETHANVHNIAAGMNGSADDALRWLLNPNRIPIVVTEEQRAAWNAAAASAGISVGEWVIYRVEAALMLEADPLSIMHEVRDLRRTLTNHMHACTPKGRSTT